jgi:hypothetical protein
MDRNNLDKTKTEREPNQNPNRPRHWNNRRDHYSAGVDHGKKARQNTRFFYVYNQFITLVL